MKKKFFAILMSAAILLNLTACSNNENPPANDPTSSPSEPVNSPDNSTPDSTPGNDNSTADPSANITFEPVDINVTEITVDPEAGYGYHHKSVYGNAFGLIYSYGSADGATVSNVTIMIVPMEMKNIDDILATEYCEEIKKNEIAEADVGGVAGWLSTKEAAQELTASVADIPYDELYVQLKVGELAAKGVSGEEALAQAMAALANAGLAGDEK